MFDRTHLKFIILLAICALGSVETAAEQNLQDLNEQIAFYLIESQAADRYAELGGRLFITIEGTDPSKELLIALRQLGVKAHSGSEYDPKFSMHFTFKVLAILGSSERRIEYAFEGPGGSGGTSTVKRTEQGWREIEGRYWMQ